MRSLVADRYRHFVPSAPDLTFQTKKFALDGTQALSSQYSYGVSAPDEQVFDFPQLDVFVSGTKQLSSDYSVSSKRVLFKRWIERRIVDEAEVVLVHEGEPPQGKAVKLRGFVDSDLSSDRWVHLDIRRLLVQGANPSSAEVLAAHGDFQGGYRLVNVALTQPHFGQLRECAYHLGWEYQVPLGWSGMDSFSYCLETEFGQRSDAGCISIVVT